MDFTKITDYTEPYSILRKLNQNLFSLLQKGEHEIALPLKSIKPISEISKVPIMNILEELEQLNVSIQVKIKNEVTISESYFDRLLYPGLLELSFFEPLMKGLFRKYQPGEQYYERLFSPITRPYRQSCGCDWQALDNNRKDPESVFVLFRPYRFFLTCFNNSPSKFFPTREPTTPAEPKKGIRRVIP